MRTFYPITLLRMSTHSDVISGVEWSDEQEMVVKPNLLLTTFHNTHNCARIRFVLHCLDKADETAINLNESH